MSFVCKRAIVSAQAIVLSASLAACGGGGGGGGTGTATPSTPAPVVVTPSSFTVSSPDVVVASFQVSAGALAQPRGPGAGLTVTISDPNGAATPSAINFDGKQQITVSYVEGGVGGHTYAHTFAASEYAAVVANYSGGGGARSIALSTWKTPSSAGADSHDYLIYRLLEGGGKPADYVQLAEWRQGIAAAGPSRISGFHLLGDATPAASMPRTGSASYSGMAAGKYFATTLGTNYQGVNFTALAAVNVNFAGNSFSSTVNGFSYEGGAGPALTMSVVGPVVGSTFTGSASTTGVVMRGLMEGQFYGPASNPASEVGAVFGLTDGYRVLTGGLVAGL